MSVILFQYTKTPRRISSQRARARPPVINGLTLAVKGNKRTLLLQQSRVWSDDPTALDLRLSIEPGFALFLHAGAAGADRRVLQIISGRGRREKALAGLSRDQPSAREGEPRLSGPRPGTISQQGRRAGHRQPPSRDERLAQRQSRRGLLPKRLHLAGRHDLLSYRPARAHGERGA